VSAAAAESWETFLLALRDVADAQSEMAKLASEAGVDRVNLYRMLSGKGNPRFKNLNLILKALGLRIAAVPDSDESDIQETPPETAGADRHR
jgi:probable addiction module antidote protein